MSSPQAESTRISERVWWTAVVYLATVAMFLRFYDLSLKPLHHDEGVNALLLTGLVSPPHHYQYDPGNYHGPTLYYLAWPSAVVFGLTAVAIRFVTALAGLLAVLLVLPLRRQIGSVGAIAAAGLLALSPGAVYFSRYFIHEILLVCFTLATVVAAVMWWQRGRTVYLHLAAVSAGLMFATKETAIISAVVLIGSGVGAALFFEFRSARQDSAPTRSLRHVSSAVSTWARTVTRALGQRRDLLLVAQVLGLFLAVSILFYTSFFTHWQGAIDALKTFTIWTKTGTATHTRPWYAYLAWLSAEELPVLLLGGAGAALAIWRGESRFAVFAALWTLGILAAYSVIPYKTPWLTLNVIAPLAICGGYASELAWRYRRAVPQAVPLVGAAAVVSLASYQSVMLNFARYDDGRYPYVYVHTSREVLALVEKIRQVQEQNPGSTIAVTSRDHFPLSWYLRAYRVGYYGRPLVTNDPLVIASDDQHETLDLLLGERYERIGSYRLRPGVQLVLYARRDLRRSPSPQLK